MSRKLAILALFLVTAGGLVAVAGYWPAGTTDTPVETEAEASCTTCDARHRNLGARRDAVRALTGQD